MELIQTVGELREYIKDLPDETPVRSDDGGASSVRLKIKTEWVAAIQNQYGIHLITYPSRDAALSAHDSLILLDGEPALPYTSLQIGVDYV